MHQDPALAAVTTYRYLRVALVALVVLLFSAVALEWWRTGRSCLQPSISAYVHTPVQSVFVGVLVAMGVGLIALQGSTRTEALLLNVAGMLAPGVAFVPTSDVGTCRSAPVVVAEQSARVANNMAALFVAGGFVGVLAVVLAVRDHRRGRGHRADLLGLVGTAALLGGGAVWFWLDRPSFLAHAHGVAAVPLFLAVTGVVAVNAREARTAPHTDAPKPLAGRSVPAYRWIAGLMLLTLGAAVAGSLLGGPSHLVFWVEVALISLFAVFWALQTVELWSRGLRRS